MTARRSRALEILDAAEAQYRAAHPDESVPPEPATLRAGIGTKGRPVEPAVRPRMTNTELYDLYVNRRPSR